MFILKDTQGLDRAFFTQARCADEITRATLQKGGFVYLEHSASPNFGTPIARLADGTGTNALKKKLVYPVMITRPEPIGSIWDVLGDKWNTLKRNTSSAKK